MSGGEQDRTRLGHFLGPHGVRGGVKVYVLGDPEQLLALKRVYVEGRGWLRVTKAEPLSPGVALGLAGVTTREAAEDLRGLQVYAADDELPEPEEGVYYYHELRGLAVHGASGEVLGEVTDALDGGHQDLLVVRHPGGESFVPLQAPYVVVELNDKRRPRAITLTEDAPENLLGDAEPDRDD
ncbi:ribosome maturation factor RimM [Deinococcus multiflagellatus]|uniref:Ribosome maturation factor RimM n=1 Tax=Deinococcus multiflagellatus TaxID=1656887 RepID=A0ABW1ZGX8_9DEIO|nr:ribosome maturation factor RimM [Deinococcus multiflagellatus]MBZ9711825.1 ribosome maturation factor RimM [Deinococcus multiflagellatus]